MTPVGYMAKRVNARPDWLGAGYIVDVYSVSNCISKDFADYIDYWRHNGYWLFDSPGVIRELANEHAIDLSGTSLFFYEVYEAEFDQNNRRWRPFEPEPSFATRVVTPSEKRLDGFDVVTFSAGSSAECSPLSCNGLAAEVETNRHCLITSCEVARRLLEEGRFNNTEPGPYRVFAVYTMEWP